MSNKSPELEPIETPNLGCGILGRYPIISVISFAAVGCGVGLGLSTWDPENPEVKSNVLKWVSLEQILHCSLQYCSGINKYSPSILSSQSVKDWFAWVSRSDVVFYATLRWLEYSP